MRCLLLLQQYGRYHCEAFVMDLEWHWDVAVNFVRWQHPAVGHGRYLLWLAELVISWCPLVLNAVLDSGLKTFVAPSLIAGQWRVESQWDSDELILCIYEGYINKLQNDIILLIFKIWKFGNICFVRIRFVRNLIGDIYWNFYDDDIITVMSLVLRTHFSMYRPNSSKHLSHHTLDQWPHKGIDPVIVASVEYCDQVLPHQPHFLDHEQTFYTKHVLPVL